MLKEGLRPGIGGAPNIRGTVAYVAQVAWVQSLSLKDNVLFGRTMDEAQYREALDVACMEADVGHRRAIAFELLLKAVALWHEK